MVEEKAQVMTTYDFFDYTSDPVRATGKFERYFIQPAFGLNKKIMHVSFVPRLALVDFNEFSSDAVRCTLYCSR